MCLGKLQQLQYQQQQGLGMRKGRLGGHTSPDEPQDPFLLRSLTKHSIPQTLRYPKMITSGLGGGHTSPDEQDPFLLRSLTKFLNIS